MLKELYQMKREAECLLHFYKERLGAPIPEEIDVEKFIKRHKNDLEAINADIERIENA